MSDPRLTGAILAGGRSRRMGRDKAALRFHGGSLLEHVARRVALAAGRVIVVAKDPASLDAGDLEVVTDPVGVQAALAGLLGALQAAHTEWIAVVGCDMPFVSPSLLRAQLELARFTGCDAVVPCSDQGREVLHGVWHRRVRSEIARRIDRGSLSLQRLPEVLDVRLLPVEECRSIDPSARFARNVNTPADYRGLLGIARDRILVAKRGE